MRDPVKSFSLTSCFCFAACGQSSGSRGGLGGGEGPLYTHHDSVRPSGHDVPWAEGTNCTETGPASISAGPQVTKKSCKNMLLACISAVAACMITFISTLSYCWLQYRPWLFFLPPSLPLFRSLSLSSDIKNKAPSWWYLWRENCSQAAQFGKWLKLEERQCGAR